MKFASRLRRRLRAVIGPLLGLMAVAYFAYHTVEGDRGLLAWWHLNRDIRVAEASLSDLQHERDTLDRRARLLRPEALDRDMLEERAMSMDNLGREDELVILRPAPSH